MGTNRIIYIRTDGNRHLAAGHLVRCLSIADACYDLGMEVHFLVSDEKSRSLLLAFLTVVPLKPSIRVLKTAVYDDLEREIPEMISLLSYHDTSVICDRPILLLDSYYVTEKYLNTVGSFAKTAYIDDLQLFDYPVDLLINYDAAPDSLLPCYSRAKKALLGVSYTPLRQQFTDINYIFREHVSRILITTGGSDPYHFCLKLAEFLIERMPQLLPKSACCDALHLEIVIGRLNTDKDALLNLAEHFPFIILCENVSDMASLMKNCDLAVSAAGTTLYELCAVGVPTVSFTMADNQLTAAKAFADAGMIPCAGDIRTSCAELLRNVSDFITDMAENMDKRKSAHERMNRFVDGKGSVRIAKELSVL